MVRFIFGTDLWMFPGLAETMFRDRSQQFSKRLKWEVTVDKNGFERDDYDSINPLYVVVVDNAGKHLGSMRLLPTTGRTMLNDRFLEALNGKPIQDPTIWECTRFCVSPTASLRTALKLFASAGWLMRELDIGFLVAVFDQKMLRNYRMSNVQPKVLGHLNTVEGVMMAGQWSFDSDQLALLMSRAHLDPVELELALANSSLQHLHIRLSA